MNMAASIITIELRKEKRSGVIPLMPVVGILGAVYAFINFLVRKDALGLKVLDFTHFY